MSAFMMPLDSQFVFSSPTSLEACVADQIFLSHVHQMIRCHYDPLLTASPRRASSLPWHTVEHKIMELVRCEVVCCAVDRAMTLFCLAYTFVS
jgi:hypothetical protein